MDLGRPGSLAWATWESIVIIGLSARRTYFFQPENCILSGEFTPASTQLLKNANTSMFWHRLAPWIWFPAPERESELDFSNPCCKYHMFYNTFWVPDPPPRRFFVLFANCLVWLSRTPPGAPPATWPDPEDDET